MLEVEWTIPALSDLRDIDTWLTREIDAEKAAHLLVVIRRRADWLMDFPRGGRPSADGTRILRVFDTPYLVRYRILELVGKVQVLRVHHERQDWSVDS